MLLDKVRKLAVLVVIAGFVFMVAWLPTKAVFGQASPGQGLEISPPLIEFKVNPGQTVTTQIKLRNVTGSDITARADFNDFVAQGEDGQPKVLLNNAEPDPYSMKQWIQSIPDITLASKEQKTIPVTIVVPSSASPGGHYSVVRFTGSLSGTNGTGVSLSASLGSLLLINVNGKITEHADIKDFYTQQDNVKKSFFEFGPVNFIVRLENKGNIHLKPIGNITVTNMFGGQSAVLKLNDPAHNVLPNSIRRFENQWPKRFLFGRYRANLTLQYGSSNTIVQQYIIFWVIPYKLIILVIFGIAILLLGLRYLIKRYNRHIIKQSTKH